MLSAAPLEVGPIVNARNYTTSSKYAASKMTGFVGSILSAKKPRKSGLGNISGKRGK